MISTGYFKQHKKQLLFICVILCATLWIGYIIANCNYPADPTEGLIQGQIDLDNISVRDIQGILNERAAESGTTVFINSNIVADTGGDAANLLIQNVESNKLSCKVFITRNDTGECIYESDEIPAGYKVEMARLQGDLKEGVYPSTAAIHVLSENGTDKLVINVATTVTILR